MLRVGWQMIREHPLTGVGSGQVSKRYRAYLRPGDPRPAWHGHLHNNLLQLAAESGFLVVGAACLFVGVLLRHLWRAWRLAADQESRFIASTALRALTGFLVAGQFEYTYGHALALILLSFAALSPVIAPPGGKAIDAREFESS